MFKGFVRVVLAWGLAILLAPYVSRLFDQLARRAPPGGIIEESLFEMSDRHSAGLVRAFGESIGDLVLGPR